jgi:transcription initiation factor TFIIB
MELPLSCPCKLEDGAMCGGIGFPDSVSLNMYKCMMCGGCFSNANATTTNKNAKTATIITAATTTLKKQCCAHCGTNEMLTFESEGDVVCKICGTVFETIVSNQQEWNNYTPGVNKSRVGLESKNPFTGLGSTIQSNNRKHDSLKMAMYISGNDNPKEKAYSSVEKLIDSFALSSVIKGRAKMYWAAILNSDGYETHRNSVRRGILFSMFFYAAKDVGIPMTLDEISRCTGIDASDMNKGENIFEQMISHTKYARVTKDDQVDVAKTFERYLDYFDFDRKTKYMYFKICKEIYDVFVEYFDSREDATIISGILSFVFNSFPLEKSNKIKITQISRATGVTKATINGMVKQLKRDGAVAEDFAKMFKNPKTRMS